MTQERILWIELIGFDRDEPDLGVGKLLAKTGFTPAVTTLLIWSNDFVHSHDRDESEDTPLREDCCSYYGRPRSEEHERQPWTKGDLKRLIAELQRRGSTVYFSIFDQLMDQSTIELFQLDGIRPQWLDAHPELHYIRRDGASPSYFCPWKRLADGTYYEDFFLGQLQLVMEDYGFDGFHGADGFCRSRFAIYDGDFSNDLVGQFLQWRRGNGKALLALGIAERADLIWNRHRAEWIAFHQWRHRGFWTKIAAMLHRMSRKLIVNSVWIRDPFEAAYRYGVDMAVFHDIGVDGMVLEAGASLIELEHWTDGDADTLYKYMATISRVRARLPEEKLWVRNSVKDTLEQYNLIRHAPCLLEADIGAYGVLYHFRDGRWHPALDGVVPCLADGLNAYEWSWLGRAWDAAYCPDGAPVGVTVIWSEAAGKAELEAYCRRSFCSSYRWHFHLLAAGAPLLGIAAVDQLTELTGPILMIHPEFFPEDERQRLRDYTGGECFEVGRGAEGLLASFGEMQPPLRITLPGSPGSWFYELPEEQPGIRQLETAVRLFHAACGAPRVTHGQARVWTARCPDGSRRLTVRSDLDSYQQVKVAVPGAVTRITPRTEYFLPVYHRFDPETRLDELLVKLPPRGIVILEIRCAD